MPFVFDVSSKSVADSYSTSGTTNTEIDAAFIKAGSTRSVSVIAARVFGRGSGLTSLNGLGFRLKFWTATASSGGTAITPSPADSRASLASVATAAAGAGGGTGAVTSGTTGIYGVSFGCGASGPGGWTAPNPDAGLVLDGGATKSIDLISVATALSMTYEFSLDIQE
jgi:hypothetical protein